MNFLEKIKTLSVIGVGLIGGSIGLALKQRAKSNEQRAKSPASGGINSERRVIGVGRHKEKLIKAKKLGAIDEWTTDFEKGVRDADLVIIATPVDTIVPVTKKTLPYLKPGAIITDVGSVKAPIVFGIESFLSQSPVTSHQSPPFVGGHPLAGSEKSGITNARSDLFQGALCILTPTLHTSREALTIVRKFWEFLGAEVLTLSPQLHDSLVARSSHLPHLLAAGLIHLVANQKNKYLPRVLGPSFRDLTRIASSEPQIWNEISLSNRKEIILALNKFIKILSKLEKKLKEGKDLKTFFQRAKDYRGKIFLPRR